jgi:putative two-component system response regulator
MMQEPSKILIVDDEPHGRDVLEALLVSQEYHLSFASNGPEALAIAEETSPDLILLDVMMPGMDGFEVCRRLRASAQLSEVPIIILTALEDHDSRMQGIEAGADNFISKPFDRTELRAQVRTITRLNRYRHLMEERARAAEQARRSKEELAKSYEATLIGWVKALDLRDKETEGHSRRVTEMTTHMAQQLGMSGEELDHIRRGALLHDIGKLGIPDSILHKPGPLDEDEWKQMHKHPVYAYEWLYPIDYLRPALDIPYCHHEKWDGSGYPRGLHGTDIPLAARIFALVDVWDALRSDRPYRSAWAKERVSQHIQASAGSHFDPQLVPVFLALTNGKEC